MKITDSELILKSQHQLNHSFEIETSHSFERLQQPQSFQKILRNQIQAAQAERNSKESLELEMKEMLMDLVQNFFEQLLAYSKEHGNHQAECQCKKILDRIDQGETRPQLIHKIEVSRNYSHTEQTSFEAAGHVTTEDGKQIDINLAMHMSHHYSESMNTSIENTYFLDPLVIQHDSDELNLSEIPEEIDLNLDGILDEIFFPEKGSGFLVLDKNNNDQIDDGSEMFGPQTGLGFKELDNYDSDNNHWIDDNDEIFSKLEIWHQNDNDQKTLSPLQSLGIGAIYLGSSETPFTKHDAENNILAQIKRSGIFLKENGTPGTINELDYKIDDTDT